jgi:outer membrane lipopolysaccharide assembly protein LptE/RlpB
MIPPARWQPLLLLLLLLFGCGYRPMGAEPASPQGAPTLAIPLFANRSTEIGLEAILAKALINAFSQSRAVRLAPSAENADLVLEGKVQSAENTSVAFDSVTRSTVRRVTLRVELNLRRGSGKTIWKETVMLQEDYVVDPNYQIGETIKAEGIRRAAINMARRVLDKVLLVI